MAVFGGLELMAGEELAVQDQTAAHSGTREKADDVLITACRAEFVFVLTLSPPLVINHYV